MNTHDDILRKLHAIRSEAELLIKKIRGGLYIIGGCVVLNSILFYSVMQTSSKGFVFWNGLCLGVSLFFFIKQNKVLREEKTFLNRLDSLTDLYAKGLMDDKIHGNIENLFKGKGLNENDNATTKSKDRISKPM